MVLRPGFVLLKSLERGKISEHAFLLSCPNEKLFPSRNYQGKGYKLSAQGFLGLFGWTSVTYDWLMVALDTIDQ